MKPLVRYSVALVAVIVASALTIVLGELLAPMRLFFFSSAVLITAVVCGLGPAIVAIALSISPAGLGPLPPG